MGLFALGDDDKMQYDDVVVHWVLYPFHNDVVVKSTLSTWSSPSVNEPPDKIVFFPKGKSIHH